MNARVFRFLPVVTCLLLTGFSTTLLSGCGGGAASSTTSSPTPTPTPQALAITSISPKEVPLGASSVTVTVTGTGFTPTTVIVLQGSDEATTYVSPTQLQATVPAAQLQNGQVLALSVRNGTATANADPTTNLQVDNPVPTIGSVSPGAAVLNSGPVTVTVNGGSFVSGAMVTVNGNPRATSFVSGTQVTAALPATDFAGAGSLLLNVINPQPGGGSSGTTSFVVNNPQPAITALSPAQVQAGSAAGTLTVTGTGFVGGVSVLVNGASRGATVTSATSLSVPLTAADQAAAETLAITVVGPAPGGGVSNSSNLSVNNPVPGALTLSPTSLTAGAAAPTLLQVTGSGFNSSTVIQVNGSTRPATLVSATQMVATLSAADQATGAVLHVTASNASPGGGASPAANLPVNNPAPGAISVSPNLVGPRSSTPTPITVTGANFVPSTVVQVNGSSRATTYVSSTQLSSALTVADQAAVGSVSVTAFTPAPGGGTSTPAAVALNNPQLGYLSLSPSVLTSGTGRDQTVAVSGTGFLPTTRIYVNGAAHATTYVSSTQLSFVMPASETASASRASVVAEDPAPVANSSPYATLTITAPVQTPVISTLNPTSIVLNSADTALFVSGTNLDSNSVVQWNGTALTTGYSYGTPYGSTQSTVVATVPASFLTATGSATITVSNPTAAMPISNALTLPIILPPAPTLTSISPTSGAFNTATTVNLYGSNFTAASTVTLNGKPVTVSSSSSSSLQLMLPASALPTPGNYSFVVTTPAPGGGTSAALPYMAYIPLTTNSMVYNPVDGLFYASVPGTVAAPLGNSIVSVNPATGALGTPIFVGSEPNKLALTSDGHTLWVGLDGASAVRQVDLQAHTAGMQFGLPTTNSGTYNSPPKVIALAALPASPGSVIVSYSSQIYNGVGLAIYDNGVPRANTANSNAYYGGYNALQVDGTRNEVYAGSGSAYTTFTYNANGLTQLVSNTTISPANSTQDEMQLLSGKLVTDFGKIYDPESGSLLSTLYSSGQTVAQGGTVADVALGKIFVLDSGQTTYSYGFNQVQVFNLSDSTDAHTAIPIGFSTNYGSATRLTRWGANGLAFLYGGNIYTLQSNMVQDQSGNKADLAVSVAASGSSTTGGTSIFTATVTNNGPATATDVVLTAQAPSIGSLGTVATSVGSCSAGAETNCSLGSLANGATATVTFNVLQTASGTSTINAQVIGSSTDPVTSNNSASTSVVVTGPAYNLPPVLSSVVPAAIKVGTATDTTVTVNGSGFTAASTVNLGSAALATTFVNATQLTATVPAANAGSMGWSPVTVTTPAPGGGTSAPTTLTFYSVITLGVNHILYDPYSRQIMASVGSGSSTVTGNSIAAINPATATVGSPVAIGSQPSDLALSGDGRILYTILAGSQSVARYNMLTGAADFTYQVPATTTYNTDNSVHGIAVQPGTEDTVALTTGNFGTVALYDFDPAHQTAQIRGQASFDSFATNCLSFLNPQTLLLYESSGYSTLDRYTVTANGFANVTQYSQYASSTLNSLGCFKLNGGLLYGVQGGIANPSTQPATQVGVLARVTSLYGSNKAFEADASLRRAFYPAIPSLGSYFSSNSSDGFTAYDLNTFEPVLTLPLNMAAIEGNSNYSQVDTIRWGQDGLAMLTSTGHIYLLRGPAIVPGLLSTGVTAASLGSVSSSTLASGSGNTLLTLTGSGFAPGVAVTWNGSYRTTTIQDATHLTVAIPASDLAAAGSATLVATNPGASASNSLSVTVQ